MAYAISALDHGLWKPSSGARPSSRSRIDDRFCAEIEGVLPALRAYAHSLCGSRDTADDAVQDALLKAWGARESYLPGTNFKAWMFTILRNAFLSRVRRRKFEGTYHEGAEEGLTCPANQLDHLSVLELKAALRKLPDNQRDALMLVVLGGFSYIEVSEICGCMVGTVKSRIGRARATLQRMLDGEAEPA